jgi:hypothetical protein
VASDLRGAGGPIQCDRLAYRFDKNFRLCRLQEIFDEASAEDFSAITLSGESCERDERHRCRCDAGAYFAEEPQTILAGHRDVSQYDGRRALKERRERVVSGSGLPHSRAKPLKDHCHDLARIWVIFDI